MLLPDSKEKRDDSLVRCWEADQTNNNWDVLWVTVAQVLDLVVNQKSAALARREADIRGL